MTLAAPPSLDVPPRSISPLSALLLGAAGGALIGSRRSLSIPARAAATVGGWALIGAASQRPVVEALRRAGTRRRAASLDFSFVVPHPVDVVFDFCRDLENFPLIIGALREVRDYGDGRSHWCASTPTGGTIEWDATTTKYLPNSVIALQSVARAPVRMHATLRFTPDGATTNLKVTADYQVVNGGLADALVALVMPSREAELEADIRRLALYLDGTRPFASGAPSR